MTDVAVARTEELSRESLDAIRALLDDAFAGDFSDEDWEHTIGGWHVLATDDAVVSHAAVVERTIEVGERRLRAGYVEGVATSPSKQGRGLGSVVMAHVGRLLPVHFELGALSTDAHAFYEKLGWERWQGPTFVRHGTELRRTADEDTGIMVLRYGTAAALDLALPISCEARPGDDW